MHSESGDDPLITGFMCESKGSLMPKEVAEGAMAGPLMAMQLYSAVHEWCSWRKQRQW